MASLFTWTPFREPQPAVPWEAGTPSLAGHTGAVSQGPVWTKKVLASGLCSPDGLALDETTGDVYVTEEDGARIVKVQPDGQVTVIVDRDTPVYRREAGGCPVRVEPLSVPEGLSLHDRFLYVTEDRTGGRLIRFDLQTLERHQPVTGEIVPLPAEATAYAWESVDIGEGGEILMAGSGLESVLTQSGTEAFFGAILFRDAAGRWWMPLHTFMGGYSSACFSPDGKSAVFASETLGDVGCLDLTRFETRTAFSEHGAVSPECVIVLPDGNALVAAEGGELYHYQPPTGTMKLVLDMRTDIESIVWDQQRQRLLVACDIAGQLISLESDLSFHSAAEIPPVIPFDSGGYTVPVPETCPDYLAGVLRMGGYDTGATNLSFRDFARRVSMFAVDAIATPEEGPARPEKPFQRIQFMIMYPDFLGLDAGKLFGPASGFVAVNSSNELIRTKLIPRDALMVDTWSVTFNPLGSQKVAIPAPLGCSLSAHGVASIHFIGAGETPDFHIIINTRTPDESYMLVSQPGEADELYALALPQGKKPGHWVVAMPCDEPDTWKALSGNEFSTYR